MADGIVSHFKFEISHEIDAKLFEKFPILNMEHEILQVYISTSHQLNIWKLNANTTQIWVAFMWTQIVSDYVGWALISGG